MIATPTYTGKVDTSFVHSLLYSAARMRDAGIGFDFYALSQNCHVDDARNAVLRDFLLSECTDLVFIDADVSWEPDALVRLIQHDRDVVAGVYPKRVNFDPDFPVEIIQGQDLWSDKDGLVEVMGAPTGFMKIKRHVIEKMVKANEHRRFLGRGEAAGSDPYTIVFERTYCDGHRWSGDYNFCREWRAMGGKVFVDPEMYLTHVGEVEFSGTLGQHWKKKYGVEQAEVEENFKKAMDNIKLGEPSAQDFLNLVKGWGNPYSAQVELLSACYHLAKSADPAKGSILEAGSGLSTLIMALANPKIHIHALEHEIIWGSRLKYFLDIYNINNVTLHFGDLKQYDDGKWYDDALIPEENFSLALCDGPPRKISNRSIFYQKLDSRIKDAVVLMDDADDEAAVIPIKSWAKNYSGRDVKVLGEKRLFALSYLSGA